MSVTPRLLELRGRFENNLEVSYIPLKNSLKKFFAVASSSTDNR